MGKPENHESANTGNNLTSTESLTKKPSHEAPKCEVSHELLNNHNTCWAISELKTNYGGI